MSRGRSSDGVWLWAQLLAMYSPTDRGELLPLQTLSPHAPLSHFLCHLELGCALGIPECGHSAGVSQPSFPVRSGESSSPALVPLQDGQQSRGAAARATIGISAPLFTVRCLEKSQSKPSPTSGRTGIVSYVHVQH